MAKFFPVNEWQVQWNLCPFQEKARLYLAVSGGADSMALLDTARLFLESKPRPEILSLKVLHFNHMIRKGEADHDQRLVEAYCREKNLEFFAAKLDVPAISREEKISEELAGRKARYDFFLKVIKEDSPKEGVPVLVTGHHRGDQAETLLLHLFRGAGVDGLSGMKTWSKIGKEDIKYYLFRPFLSIPKESLTNWCNTHNLTYCQDRTNEDPSYRRNFIRLKVLPLAKTLNPSIEKALAQTAEILQDEGNFLDQLSEDAMKELLFDGRKKSSFDLLNKGESKNFFLKRNACLIQALALPKEEFSSKDPVIQRRILRKIIAREGQNDQGPDFEDIEKIRTLFDQKTGKWLNLCGMIFLCDYNGLLVFSDQKKQIFEKVIQEQKELSIPLSHEESEYFWPLPRGRIHVRFLDNWPSEEELKNPRFCYFNPRGIQRLTVKVLSGQIPFEKYGGGTKPLRRMMNDWHVPAFIRYNYPIIWDGQKILWVPWAGRSKNHLIEPDQPVVQLEWRQKWTKD